MEPEDTPTLDLCSPFTPPGVFADFRAEWRTEAVLGLAEGVLADSAFERLPILADALEEAGCDSAVVLNHCRDPIPHDAHCWLLPLVAGKPELTAATLERELQRLEERLAVIRQEQQERLAALVRERIELERELAQLRRRNRRRFRRRMVFCCAIGVVIGHFIGEWLAQWLFG